MSFFLSISLKSAYRDDTSYKYLPIHLKKIYHPRSPDSDGTIASDIRFTKVLYANRRGCFSTTDPIIGCSITYHNIAFVPA